MKKTELFNKIMTASKRPIWKQVNHQIHEVAKPQVLQDAYRIATLKEKELLQIEFFGKDLVKEENTELQTILSNYPESTIDADSVGYELFQSSWHKIDLCIADYGDDEEVIGSNAKEKLETIIKFYPKYQWLKQNHLNIKGGLDLFTKQVHVTQEAFRIAKVQGRFIWNTVSHLNYSKDA